MKLEIDLNNREEVAGAIALLSSLLGGAAQTAPAQQPQPQPQPQVQVQHQAQQPHPQPQPQHASVDDMRNQMRVTVNALIPKLGAGGVDRVRSFLTHHFPPAPGAKFELGNVPDGLVPQVLEALKAIDEGRVQV